MITGKDMTLEGLTARIDQLESRNAMRDLVTDYCHGFDKRDWPRFLNIWWEDCVWDIGSPFGSFAGHEGIRAAVKDILWPFWRETHHLTTNLKIWFDDADHARGESDVDCTGASMDDQPQMISATYRDKFERRKGIWKIRNRDVTLHYFNPIPGAKMSPPGVAE
jgi:ketosteroid isomerase-like protein